MISSEQHILNTYGYNREALKRQPDLAYRLKWIPRNLRHLAEDTYIFMTYNGLPTIPEEVQRGFFRHRGTYKNYIKEWVLHHSGREEVFSFFVGCMFQKCKFDAAPIHEAGLLVDEQYYYCSILLDIFLPDNVLIQTLKEINAPKEMIERIRNSDESPHP